MFKLPAILFAGCLLLWSPGSAWTGNANKAGGKEEDLLVNGSFEDGPALGDSPFRSLEKESKDLKGWTVTRGQIDYVGGYWQHADGKHSVDLHGSPGYGGLKQSFKSKKGQKYRLTFSLAGNPEGTAAEKKVGVRAAGTEESFTADSSGKTKEAMGWSTQVWDFTAAETETTLEIYSLMKADPNCGPVIDNISIVAVDD